MPLSAIETTRITDELMIVFKENTPTTRDVMVTAGVAGEAAKAVEVEAVVDAVLAALYGQTAPTILP